MPYIPGLLRLPQLPAPEVLPERKICVYVKMVGDARNMRRRPCIAHLPRNALTGQQQKKIASQQWAGVWLEIDARN